MTKPPILIIEDDELQAVDLKSRLEKNLEIPVEVISTESTFLKRVDGVNSQTYTAAVVDMMLRWTDPAPNMEPPPPEVLEEGSYTAGLRCCRALAAKGVRCIIFTALSPNAIPLKPVDVFEIIHKGGDGYAALLEALRRPG